ncbi:trypsin-like peptidase domain-containing protein [Comamonas flocculans]|uniref:Trypsin-like peptidase domain-containing protein n=2 Tax=Comamonas flocculans TaxID=2597701 RepID=A0A5B8RX90_9BURK|nr:trypsin-like peptidase domain-containing protein [Comamonas flocculans]
MHSHATRLALLACLLALTACGGGSSESPPAPQPPAPAPAPEPPAPPPAATDRIEPFDPGLAAKQAPMAKPAAPALPATAQITQLTLPPLAPTPPAGVDADAGAPLQIGTGRSLTATASTERTTALLHWQDSGRGTRIAALRFVARGAQGLRLGLQVQALPADARLWFVDATGQAQLGTAAQWQALAARNTAAGMDEDSARRYWSPELAGEQATLILEIPADAPTAQVRLAVPLLSHTTVTPEQQLGLAKAAGSCEASVSCSPEFIEQGRSVARLRYVEADGRAYQCSGTLMNDMGSSGTPWLLTARHCIADQGTASTLSTDWLLRASACGASSTAAGHVQRTGGATLLYADEGSDTSFLRLNDSAPPGVVYAGSYFGSEALPGTAVSVVHHPQGDLQQLSRGTLTGYSVCNTSTNLCIAGDATSATFLAVNWQQGVVEPGSSGAGAFITLGQRRYLVGQLFGGTSSCSNPAGRDYFGRFELSFAQALHRWLKP